MEEQKLPKRVFTSLEDTRVDKKQAKDGDAWLDEQRVDTKRHR